MNTQNIFELLTDDPVEYTLNSLKAKLAIALVELIREKGWTQTATAEQLQISQPRVSNLVRGKLDKFSIDALLSMLVRTGYKIDSTFDPSNSSIPLTMEVKKGR
ncbi:putative XRE-type DNA-binding protein [Xanthomonas arboricola]|uniref:helix-turn-helix domain-containing protein n=1 Tax=Xanthomonas sp. 3793 TaxID=3035312 RepID=UPI00216A5EFB|nr:helix-turn-helix transcriptional regulator [Xanthomonas sp. 3793]MCS3745808.1 putative XRE-type DNA-binding protein [Xanthomonas sp. 3793]